MFKNLPTEGRHFTFEPQHVSLGKAVVEQEEIFNMEVKKGSGYY